MTDLAHASVLPDQRELTQALKNLRPHKGLTFAKLLDDNPLTSLPAVEAMVAGHDSGANRSRAAVAVIHQLLHHLSDDRNFRALAWALNLDVAMPWTGAIVRLSNGNLTDRRKQLAKIEHVAEDHGKPMLDWENKAIIALAKQLLQVKTPPISLDGSPWQEPDTQTVHDPQPAPAQPQSTEEPHPEPAPVSTAQPGTISSHHPAPAQQGEPPVGQRQRKASRVQPLAWLAAGLLAGVLVGASAVLAFAAGGSSGLGGTMTVMGPNQSPAAAPLLPSEPTATSTVEAASAAVVALRSAEFGEATSEATAPAGATAVPEPTPTLEPTATPTLEPTATPTAQPTMPPEPTPTVSRPLRPRPSQRRLLQRLQRQHHVQPRFRMLCPVSISTSATTALLRACSTTPDRSAWVAEILSGR